MGVVVINTPIRSLLDFQDLTKSFSLTFNFASFVCSQLCCCAVTDICLSVSGDRYPLYTTDGHQRSQVSY